MNRTALAVGVLLATMTGYAHSSLAALENQLMCKGSQMPDLADQLVAAKVAQKNQQGQLVLVKGSTLFGLPVSETVDFEWAPDPVAKATAVTLRAKERDVRAALAKQGANLKAKKPPFVVVVPTGSSTTMVVCAWNKALDMP